MKNVLALIGFILAGVIYFAYTQPAYSTVKALKAEIGEYNQALQKASELKKLKEALLSRYNAFDPIAKDRLQKMLPDHVDNVRLILDMDSLAAKFNMPIQNVAIQTDSSNEKSESQMSVKPAAGMGAVAGAASNKTAVSTISASKQKYESLTLSFSTRTTYDTFIAFIEALQSSLRMVDIISLSVSPEGSSKGERLYNYDITIKTYWLR